MGGPFCWGGVSPRNPMEWLEKLQRNFWHQKRERPLGVIPSDDSVKARCGERGQRAEGRGQGAAGVAASSPAGRAWFRGLRQLQFPRLGQWRCTEHRGKGPSADRAAALLRAQPTAGTDSIRGTRLLQWAGCSHSREQTEVYTGDARDTRGQAGCGWGGGCRSIYWGRGRGRV